MFLIMFDPFTVWGLLQAPLDLPLRERSLTLHAWRVLTSFVSLYINSNYFPEHH
jgi:hypothetical protein